MNAKTWVAQEIELTSAKTYANPFEDVDIEAVFTLGNKIITFPGFWDGGNTWKLRFALNKEGVWNYVITCTDKENTSLTQSGTVTVTKYDGDLEIYKRGFLKTKKHTPYFMYNDGTPFFYLGDTHWTFCTEEFDSPGDRAGDIECESHFKYIVDKRVEQGFTVYQSEPLDAGYNLSKGLFESDLAGFRKLDERFKYIAEKGLVHSNAQLVFCKFFVKWERYDDLDYISRLMKYWIARYGAYPCLWTLAQEVDNDFYRVLKHQTKFHIEDNPYKFMAEELHKYDPFKQPLTAHMEYFSIYPPPGMDCTSVSSSAFRKVKSHSWWAYQWSRKANEPMDYVFAKDGWLNGQGKVCVLYESSYEGLATGNFGARSKGWIAYLNGLFGYGYGAQDMWFYRSRYESNTDANDGMDIITKEKKQSIIWGEAIKYEAPTQLGYMRKFFEENDWHKLVPRFDNLSFFIPDKEGFHAIATDERDMYVLYLCNIGYETGRLNYLEYCEYTYQWFNPRTGEYLPKHTFYPDVHRMYKVEQKPDELDWVLLVKKKK